MSFIYDDKKLLADLIKSAVDHEVKFNKHGQIAADPSVNAELRNYLTLTKKLADQLEQKYFPPPADAAAVSTGTGKDANLGVPELSSLGNFLDFIVNNQITVGGQRVAYGANEKNPDPRQWKPVTAEQVKFMMETQTAEGDRAQFQADYYVNPALLSTYINSMLRDNSKEDESTQRFTKTMLGARIQDVNRIFKTKLTTDYKEPEVQTGDDKEVDRLPKVLDPQHPLAKGSEISLFYKDIKSAEAFHAWLGASKIAIKVDETTSAAIGDEKFNQCVVLNVLGERAQSLSSLSTVESKAWSAAYLRQIVQIASQTNCQLTGVSTNPAAGAGGRGGASDPAALYKLATLLPFNADEINTRDLKIFADMYARLFPDPKITALVQQANKAFQDVDSNMLSPGAPIPMDETTLTTTGFKMFTQQPQILASNLYTCISVVGRLYELFVINHRQEIADNKSMGAGVLQSVEQQIAPGGPQKTNLGDLLQLIKDLKADWEQGFKK